MSEPIRILIVEDLPTDAELATREIRKSLPDCEFQRVETEDTYLEALEKFKPDLVLSDYHMPRFTGMQALKLAQERAPQTPLVIYTGSKNEDIAVDCMKAGAANYIIKENIKRLGTAIVHALEEKKVHIERKQAADALQRSEIHYRTLFENASDGILYLSPDLKIAKVNESFARMHGYSIAEMQNMNLQDLDTPETTRLAAERVTRLMAGGTLQFEVEHYHKDGHVFPLEVSASLVSIGGDVIIQTFHRDITERKRAEQALRESETKLQSILANSRDAIGVSKEGVHVYANPAYGYMFGYEKADDLVGTPIIHLIAPESREMILKNIQDRAKGLPVPSDYEAIALRRDGTTFIMEVRVSTYRLQGEQYTLVIMRDITERKQAEEKLRKNEERLRSIFEAMTEGFSIQEVICNDIGQPSDLRFVEANDAFERQTGLKNAETLGHTLLELFPQSESYWIERYGKVGLTGEPDHFEAMFGPLNIYYQVNAFQTELGRFGVLFTDINERKQSEEALKEKVNELEHFNNLMVSRELRMIELKKEMNEVCLQTGQPARYNLDFTISDNEDDPSHGLVRLPGPNEP